MLLGAAKLLKQHEKEVQGTVKLIFQPAEEGGGGARVMINEGSHMTAGQKSTWNSYSKSCLICEAHCYDLTV